MWRGRADRHVWCRPRVHVVRAGARRGGIPVRRSHRSGPDPAYPARGASLRGSHAVAAQRDGVSTGVLRPRRMVAAGRRRQRFRSGPCRVSRRRARVLSVALMEREADEWSMARWMARGRALCDAELDAVAVGASPARRRSGAGLHVGRSGTRDHAVDDTRGGAARDRRLDEAELCRCTHVHGGTAAA